MGQLLTEQLLTQLIKWDNLQSNFCGFPDDGLLRQSGNFHKLGSVLSEIEYLDRAFFRSGVQDLTAVVDFKLNQGILFSEGGIHETLEQGKNYLI